jgi:hypothetical protein
VEIEKTGQVLVRTCSTKRRHPAGRIALSVAPNRANARATSDCEAKPNSTKKTLA